MTKSILKRTRNIIKRTINVNDPFCLILDETSKALTKSLEYFYSSDANYKPDLLACHVVENSMSGAKHKNYHKIY